MAAVQEELLSFLSKFQQLNSCGRNATLNLNSYHGSIFVNFHVELGFPHPVPWPNNQKPSRVRRRKRRADIRHQNQQMCDSTQEEVFNEVLNNEENVSSCEIDNVVSTTECEVVAEVMDSSFILKASSNCLASPDSRSSQNKATYNCDNCGEDFGSKERLRDHEKAYQYGCDICAICYRTIPEAENHDSEKHPTLDE